MNRPLAASSVRSKGKLGRFPHAVFNVFDPKPERLLLDPDATEAAFKAQSLDDFEIIHIAAREIAGAKIPDRAALVLRSDPKTGEDGLLQVREIRDLSLNADLVTLSACDTGIGPVRSKNSISLRARQLATKVWCIEESTAGCYDGPCAWQWILFGYY